MRDWPLRRTGGGAEGEARNWKLQNRSWKSETRNGKSGEKRDFSLRRPTHSQERMRKKKSACFVRNDRVGLGGLMSGLKLRPPKALVAGEGGGRGRCCGCSCSS